MPNITDLINSSNYLAQETPSSQFGLHALTRDSDGKLTYTKSLFANTDESIAMTDGTGFAYNGLEEMIRGTTDSGVVHNTIPINQNEVGDKVQQSKTIVVRVVNGAYELNVSGVPGSLNAGNTNIELEVTYGATYTFETTDPSTQGYPIYISTQPMGANVASEYLLGVTNSRSAYGGANNELNTLSSGPLIFTIPPDAPSVLYYASMNHSNVYGKLNVVRETTNLKHRKYEQVRFESVQLTYYINSRGFLVARYGSPYTYTGPA